MLKSDALLRNGYATGGFERVIQFDKPHRETQAREEFGWISGFRRVVPRTPDGMFQLVNSSRLMP